MAAKRIALHSGWEYLEPLVGEVRIRVVSTDRAKPVFIGIAKAPQAARLLASRARSCPVASALVRLVTA
ncbi:MAG TPA: hypothetical protein VKS82_14660 [Streptosporangiaceae bacterium]|nr:hypothetical protein [Streptosporangiaceae bacterium]